MLYKKPNNHVFLADFSQSYSQYELVVTQEACPQFLTWNLGFSGEGFLRCGDSVDVSDTNALPDQVYTLRCSNIEGTYSVTLFNSEAYVSSGLSCSEGSSPIAIPLSISPDLPDDCIVNQFSLDSEPDLCNPIS
jgi:hypothetical protein